MRKKASLLLFLLLALLLLSACGTESEITINDRGVITTLQTRLPKRVDQILREAELELREGDGVVPALDAAIDRPQEIVIRRESVVQLSVDGVTRTLICPGGTVGELLEREGVELGGDRHVNVPPEEYLRDGMEIFVADSFLVELRHDGESELLELRARTVGEALVEAGLSLSALDRVEPAPESLLSQGMTVTVRRVRVETLEQEEPLGYETVYRKDYTLGYDEERVGVEGKAGLARVRYRVTLVDGEEESRELIRSETLVEPVDELIRVGPRDPSKVTVVSKKAYFDCDGSGHGYYEITYSDGSVEYEAF